MRYVSHGIHSRLYYVVEHSGGLNKVIRRAWLAKEFRLNDEALDIVLMYNVEEILNEITIEELIERVRIVNHNRELEGRDSLKLLNRMYTMLACNTNMLRTRSGRGYYD